MDGVPLTTEQLWKNGKNDEPKEHQRFKQTTLDLTPLVEVVDLFCGGGGFSEGAKQAGCQVVLAIDCWKPALDVHHANHPNVPTINLELGGSIVETAILIREHLTKGSHFHLHGSPPCQALSNASRTNAEEGLALVNWFLELVEYMKPDSWSMENVIPLGKHLKRLHPTVPFEKLNSADFGVPQTRRRIFAGVGWEAKPTHTKEEWVSVIEALPGLEGELQMTVNKNIRQRGVDEPFRTITAKTPSQTRIVSNTGGCSSSMSRRCQSVDTDITQPVKTLTNNPISLRHIKAEALGSNAKRQNDRTVEEPIKTICGSGNQVGARIFDHSQPTAEKIRSLTLDETKILQGFPADYLIPYERKRDAWVIVGNAVCPPVAKAIMEGLK